MPSILYIAYWGALEPLGRSLIIPSVKLIAAGGNSVTLITFEKPDDLSEKKRFLETQAELNSYGINWLPQKYHKTPKIPATLFDITNGIFKGLVSRKNEKFDIVHARTYIGGLIGLPLAKLLRAKYIYHNEGFYPDEQVDGGVWVKDSRTHRVAKRLEGLMYDSADGVITLSERAKSVVRDRPTIARKRIPVIVVPSCVDLEHFKVSERKEVGKEPDAVRLVYIGSVGNRYLLDRIAAFVKTVKQKYPKTTLQIFSKAERSLVKDLLNKGGLQENEWSLESVEYSDIPKRLSNFDVGLFFLTNGLSEFGCSPTKIGEYWAAGLPIISTPNVSDTDKIIREYNVGVILNDHADETYLSGFERIREIIIDRDTPKRCRNAAEIFYSLSVGQERLQGLYDDLTG